jgi:hypothetical protein
MISNDLFDVDAMRVLNIEQYEHDHMHMRVLIFIKGQQHPVCMPDHMWRSTQEARFKYVSDELKRRQRSKMFADNRHEHFKHFREATA